MILFPENIHLKIEQTNLDKTLTIFISSTKTTAICTSCGTTASQIHSRYQRHLRDLPVSGSPVTLLVEVRRFFCRHPTCSRKTFAEPFLPLAERYAQRTNRLQATLQQLALALGGEAGARLGARLGFRSSPASLLRLIRQIGVPAPSSPVTHIGMDDWAFKRGQRYGTLICDLDTGKPLELLPDRTVQTVSTWLKNHPDLEIISRDRWSEYATAAQTGAPQATQVADRWHILHNLTESVAALFPRIREELGPGTRKQAPSTSSTQVSRHVQYLSILALQRQGLRWKDIARQTGISESTIARWLKAGHAPSGRHGMRSASAIDPYHTYLRQRWQEGCRKGSVLCRELKAQGYRGSERAVYRFLTYLQEQSSSQELSEVILPALSSKQATWLLVKQPSDLDEEEQQKLVLLRQTSATAETAYHLIQAFEQMLRKRQGQQLEAWLKTIDESGLPALQTFAAGIRRDQAAVQAGLTLPYSNGLLEGQVNRLKLIKRSMYGRANFDLLRLRVLSVA